MLACNMLHRSVTQPLSGSCYRSTIGVFSSDIRVILCVASVVDQLGIADHVLWLPDLPEKTNYKSTG